MTPSSWNDILLIKLLLPVLLLLLLLQVEGNKKIQPIRSLIRLFTNSYSNSKNYNTLFAWERFTITVKGTYVAKAKYLRGAFSWASHLRDQIFHAPISIALHYVVELRTL